MAEGLSKTKSLCSASPLLTSEYDDDHGANRKSDPSQPCPNGQAEQGSVSAPGPKPQAEFSQEAPAEAPSNSLSKVDEATVPKRIRKRNGKQKRNSNTHDQPTFEDLFGINSDSWTIFFILNGTGDLDNLDIYEDLNKKLKDDFDCIRRRDGSVMIDAKTRRNAIEVEKLQKPKTKMSIQQESEFKNEENLEERIQGHLQQQNIPVSNVTIFKKNSRKGNTLTCACINFESRSMPASVRVGFEKVKVKEDIPKPGQCYTCWNLGHAKKHCEGIPCCPICGTLIHTLQQQQPPLEVVSKEQDKSTQERSCC